MRHLFRTLLATGTAVAALAGAAAMPATAAGQSAGPRTRAAATTLAFRTAPTPKLTGTLAPGQTVTATAGTWSPTPTRLTYTFYKMSSDGDLVQVQTGTSNRYVLRNTDNTYRMKVKVTAERAGYATTSRMSWTSLHVLLPQARQLLAQYGGDWHDQYWTGTDTSRPEGRPTEFRRFAAPHHEVYLEVRCANAQWGYFGAWADIDGDMSGWPMGYHMNSTFGSAVIFSSGPEYPLVGMSVACAGNWSAIARPVATAPTVYGTAKGEGLRAFLYTGPAVERTFSVTPRASEWELYTYVNPVRSLGSSVVLTQRDGVTSEKRLLPAGPALMMTYTSGLTWEMK